VTTVCSRTSVVANLAAQEQGSYSLTVTNGSEGTATFDVTYGTVGLQRPQGPNGLTGGTGATGAMGPQGPGGPAGANGTNGADGAAGPQGPQGPVGSQGVPDTNGTNGAGMNWTGPWSATTSYNVGDAVSYYGASYLAIQSGAGQEPGLVFTLTDKPSGQVVTWTLPAIASSAGNYDSIGGGSFQFIRQPLTINAP